MSFSRAGAGIRPAFSLGDVRSAVGLPALTALSSLVVAFLVVAGGTSAFLRLLCALAIAFLLISMALARPAAGVVATIVYLVFMEFLRRVLIGASDWLQTDPLLLVGPLVAITLLVKLFVLERRRLAPDTLSVLVTVMLALTFLEVANPTGNGIGSNLAGLLYAAAPVFWFYVGREVLTASITDRVLSLVVVLSVIVAGYGLYQTQVGDPPWDINWLNVTGGYNALNVGDTIRAFGTFASSAEYALFLGAGLSTAVAFILRGRLAYLPVVPFLGFALFLSSGRSALITAFAAVVVMLGLRTKSAVAAALIAVIALGGAYGGLKVVGSGSSASALVSHQLGGLSDPLDPNSSTLLLHWKLVEQGVVSGVSHVIGRGPGVTNNASGVGQSSTSTSTQATEVDISNAFVSLGVVGGLIYLAIVLSVFLSAMRNYFAGQEVMLPIVGLLIVGLGQWLIGGDYALSPFTWMLIGVVAAGALRRRGDLESAALADRDPGDLGPARPARVLAGTR